MHRIKAVQAALSSAFIAVALNAAVAQERFPTETILLPTASGYVEREVEVADTSDRRAQGYMHRTDIEPDDGMLFVFDPPRPVSMWMRNTPTSLDMIFIENDGTIESIRTDTIPFSTDITSSRGKVGFVLELLAGRSEALGLREGAKLRGERFGDTAVGRE